MKESNHLETQLRSWTPRRPSPGLEGRLFGRTSCASHVAWLNGWLVPATACMLLAGLLLCQSDSTNLSETTGRASLVAVSLSNQSYAAYLPGSFQRAANRLDTFEWTKGGDSTFPMGSLSPVKAGE